MIDLAGKRFGKWTVLSHRSGQKWLCRCECGAELERDGASLRHGRSRSCLPCARLEHSGVRTHGQSRKRLHRIWCGMRGRCNNQRSPVYPRYGGRGIAICAEWDSFVSFSDWAMANGYGPKLTIDRRDNDGPYSPENCRWATQREQNRNYSRVRMVEYRGERLPVIELAERVGLKPYTLRQRLYRFGWDIEKAVTTPVAA